MWLTLCRQDDQHPEAEILRTALKMCPWMEKLRQFTRVTRKRRALFPLPSFGGTRIAQAIGSLSFEDILDDTGLVSEVAVDCWTELGVMFCARLHDGTTAFCKDDPILHSNWLYIVLLRLEWFGYWLKMMIWNGFIRM